MGHIYQLGLEFAQEGGREGMSPGVEVLGCSWGWEVPVMRKTG